MTFVTTQISSCPFSDTIELNKELENMTSPILQASTDIFANIQKKGQNRHCSSVSLLDK